VLATVTRGGALGGALSLLSPALLAVGLSGCGFRPVYGDRGRVGTVLTSVDVAPIANRDGQILRNILLDRLRPGADASRELVVTFILMDQDLGVNEGDKPSIKTLHGVARWRLLTRVADGRQRQDLSSVSRGAVTYNILDNQYATERNRRAAGKAIADQIAAEIETQLMAYFGAQKEQADGPAAYPGF